MPAERPLRLAMVGGGAGSLIGDSHRIAARLDGRWRLVAGAFDADPSRGRAFGRELGLEPDRAYGEWRELLAGEAGRDDRPDLVAVVTPNASHFEIARAVLEAGFHLLCEKPLTTRLDQARELVALARDKGRVGAVMHGYSGYPLVRQMRAMVAAGELGRIRVVQAEFAHGGHAGPVERDVPALAWRYDPAIAGPSSALADAGSHALHMASFVTGQEVTAVAAMLARHGAGRRLEDDAHLHLRFDGGAIGALWASAVAVGSLHGLRLRVYGDRAGMEWAQERPDQLAFTPIGEPTRALERGSPYLHPEARRASRISAGHAEGYFEGFANIYRDLAEAIAGGAPGPYPDLAAGAQAVAVIEAALASAGRGGAWVEVARA